MPPVSDFFEIKFKDKSIIKLFREGIYKLMECAECSLLFQQSVLDEEHTQKLYNEWLIHSDAEELSKKKDYLKLARYYAQEVATIAHYFERSPATTNILDYGMGGGSWCKMAQAFGFAVYGTDLSNHLLTNAANCGVNVIPVDEIERHHFHFINTEQVFEHLTRPLDVLKMLYHSLTTGGVIKVSVPDGSGIKSKLRIMDWKAPRGSRKFLIPVTPLIHINTFSYKSIRRMGELAGFEVINLPLRKNYTLIDASSATSLVKSLIRPVYRRLTPATYLFLRKVK